MYAKFIGPFIFYFKRPSVYAAQQLLPILEIHTTLTLLCSTIDDKAMGWLKFEDLSQIEHIHCLYLITYIFLKIYIDHSIYETKTMSMNVNSTFFFNASHSVDIILFKKDI